MLVFKNVVVYFEIGSCFSFLTMCICLDYYIIYLPYALEYNIINKYHRTSNTAPAHLTAGSSRGLRSISYLILNCECKV
jgi:hypothetical protein